MKILDFIKYLLCPWPHRKFKSYVSIALWASIKLNIRITWEAF